MKRTQGFYLVVLPAVALVGMIWFFVSDKAQDPPDEMSQTEACDSCSARHKNLTRLRDARTPAVMKDE